MTVLIKCIKPIVQIPIVQSNRESHQHSCDQYSADKRFEIIGLFPINRTNIDAERLIWLEVFNYYISQINKENCDLFSYRLYEVEDQSYELTNTTFNILSDRRYKNIQCFSRNVGVLGPLTGEQARSISRILDQRKIPVLTTLGSCLISNRISHSHVLSIPTHIKQVKVIKSLLKYFNWTYISVVYHDTNHGILQ